MHVVIYGRASQVFTLAALVGGIFVLEALYVSLLVAGVWHLVKCGARRRAVSQGLSV